MKNVNGTKEKDVEIDDLDYKINNIVATVKVEISEKFELVEIARKLTDSEYFPERFPGLILRQKNPRATFLIFSTGKMVITGLEEVNNAETAVTKLIKKIKKFGIKNTTPEIIIQNMVASGDFHQNIDLNKAVILMESIMYEPEVFPGLIYNMKDPRAVFLLFSTGKFVCTGVKTEKILKTAILKLIKEIKAMDLASERVIEDKFELSFI
ncbi:MAG: TATA-box-binding protein [Candidatus Lokiarchaeota archaeon]|jgi:transcription initiation factor TFIID TATA-box-binding protein